MDHGTAGVSFIIGDTVKGGMYGEHPSQKPENLEQQQRSFGIPMSVNFDRENNRLIVCDTQRGRLQIYEKDNSFQDSQLNL